jgi:hypothetical protein
MTFDFDGLFTPMLLLLYLWYLYKPYAHLFYFDVEHSSSRISTRLKGYLYHCTFDFILTITRHLRTSWSDP